MFLITDTNIISINITKNYQQKLIKEWEIKQTLNGLLPYEDVIQTVSFSDNSDYQ